MIMSRNKKIAIGIAGGIILAIAIGAFAFYQHQFSAPQKEAETERIVVNLTTTEEELIPKLKEQGYIRSEWAFNYVLKKKGWQGKIEPGGYKVSKSMNAWELADTLVNHPYQKWVVIPEGLRKEEIAERMQEKLGWAESTKKEFVANSKEGYLFPDTYLLNLDYTGREVARRMQNKFNEEVADLFKEARENNIRNDTLIVLASLVQREAASEKEMPLIAGIIWNRWLQDMKFEIDATVQYALGEVGNWWPVVKPEDYKLDSPYNTYLHKGRPPAPICNPGLAAIDAVINSEDSEYLYYLHDSEGQIHPAKTYGEHLENIDKYLILPKVREMVTEFMAARIQRKQPLVENFLTDNAKQQYAQPGLTLIGTSNPHFADFEILEREKLNDSQFRFKVRIYEEYTGQGRVGYFDETLTIIKKKNNKYLIDSVERSEYTNL